MSKMVLKLMFHYTEDFVCIYQHVILTCANSTLCPDLIS